MKLDFLSKKPWVEPVKEMFIRVKNQEGKEVWLKQWRDSVSEPLRREIINKKIEARIRDIQIQEREIEKQLLRESLSLAEWTVEGFVLILRNILQEEYNHLKNALESNNPQEEMTLYESDHPLVFFLELTPHLIERILYNIERVINAGDRDFLKDFINRQNEQDGVIPLRVIWDFE